MHLFRVSPDNDALRGALLMTGAAICFAAMAVLIRYITRDVHPFEAAFFRNLFGLIPMIPWMLRHRLSGLRTLRLKLHFIRAVIGLAGMLCLFSALAIAPAAQVIAINFTVPILTTILAAVVLGEVVRARRWSAVAIGFVGAMIITGASPDVLAATHMGTAWRAVGHRRDGNRRTTAFCPRQPGGRSILCHGV